MYTFPCTTRLSGCCLQWNLQTWIAKTTSKSSSKCWIIFAYILLLVVVIQDRKYRELYFGIMTKAFYVSDLVYPLKMGKSGPPRYVCLYWYANTYLILILDCFYTFPLISFHTGVYACWYWDLTPNNLQAKTKTRKGPHWQD